MHGRSSSPSKGRHYLKQPATTMKFLSSTPSEYRTAISALNAQEERQRFFEEGKLPEFILKGSESRVEELMNESVQQIRFDLFHHARSILDSVMLNFGDFDSFIETSYGRRISVEQAVPMVHTFLQDHALDGKLSVLWTPDLQCTGLMTSTGPLRSQNNPEKREFTLLLRSTEENNYLRDPGIVCLMYHEVGTHYMRAHNEGQQPWYSDRKRFGLCPRMGSLEMIRNEEGLATLHTVFSARVPYLANSALSYYSACMASFLDFKSLFTHLEKYVKSPENRWRICLRIKRALRNPNRPGGIGKDQRYFEGAVDILAHLEEIDFRELMSGKLCWNELPRVRRVIRIGSLKYPDFMRDTQAYRQRLVSIRRINGLSDVVVSLDSGDQMTRQDLLEELLRSGECPELLVQREFRRQGGSLISCFCCLPQRPRSRQKRRNQSAAKVTPVPPVINTTCLETQ